MVGARWLALLVVTLPAPAQEASPEEQRELARATQHALTNLRDALREDLAPLVLEALADMAGADDPKSVELLLKLLGDGEPAYAPLARRALAGYTRPDSLKLLGAGLQARSADVREQVLLALGEGRPAGVDWIARAATALEDEAPRVRAAAVRALGRARATSTLEALLALAADDSERVRLEVPGALVRLADTRALPVLDGLARDPRWRVRLAVIEALAHLAVKDAALRLAGSLGTETGRLREDALLELQRLTGVELGLDPVGWRHYLDGQPEDLRGPGDALLPTSPRCTGGLAYHDVRTTSRRFVLVTDLSGSMEYLSVVPSQYGDQPQPRLDVARNELDRLISLLDESVAFDLVTFADRARRWHGKLASANGAFRTDARREVASWRASGGTNIYEALQLVFDQAETALDAPLERAEDLDTLFLISDGVPSAGDLRSPELLLQYVEERNRSLRLRIHCISLTGEAEGKGLLQRLAALTGGEYRQLVLDV